MRTAFPAGDRVVSWVRMCGSAALVVSAATVGGAPHPAVGGTAREACVPCHAPVVDRPVLHGPVAAGPCLTCHRVDGEPGQPVIVVQGNGRAGDVSGLCLRCHAEVAETLDDPVVHGPVKGGACTTCHDPHGSRFRSQLAQPPRETCLGCHREIAEALAAGFVHAPAAASCTTCHDAHASRHPSQLRQPIQELCLGCHAEVPTGPDPPPDGAPLAGGAAAPPPVSGGRRVHLDEGMTTGHPIRGHPVSGRPDPVDGRRPLTCVSCHNPHGGRARQLFRFGAVGVSGVCVGCHPF